MISLDSRLKMCAGFVRQGASLADIGTDHAYLPSFLCQRGICPHAIAADINSDPLRRGELTVKQEGLTNKIELRLSDGLSQIGEDEADDIVIAGMGGELIARIVDSWEYSKNENKHFILQPMTRSEALLSYLSQNGFSVEKQDCCVAAGKCYTVICAVYTGVVKEENALFPYLGLLRPRENELHARFVKNHIARLEKKAIGVPKYRELADALKKQIQGNL